ncbi:dual specificity protein phosphatase 18 isoform X2 [Dendrobates tinctorius]|uniref:dual specificity protein phosphatase 18 isoform X2 n=1 Tax=Dendrobates tinctorius TaxID=92724 RepID=UPI003CC979E4
MEEKNNSLNRFHGGCNIKVKTKKPCVKRRRMSISGFSKVTDHLFLSNAAAASKATLLTGHDITCVINVSLECSAFVIPYLEYLHFPVADLPETPLYDNFQAVSHKIKEVAVAGGRTLIYCAAGISRSPTLCLAYLMEHHGLSLLAAHTHLKQCRPIIRPNIGFWKQLIAYELYLFGKNTVQIIDSPIGCIPDIYENEAKNMVPF